MRLLPPASTTVIGVERDHTIDRGRYRISPAGGADVDACVATFARLLDTAVVRRREADTALALSGGLDSRCLASIVGRRWPGSRAFTFGSPGSEEIERASRVGAIAGLDHRLIELGRGYVARGAAETVWLSEGQIRCFHSHHLALRTLRRSHGVTSLLVGYAGDAVVRADPMPGSVGQSSRNGHASFVDTVHERSAVALDDLMFERVLTPRFAGELRGRAHEALARVLSELDGPGLLRRVDFTIQEIYRRKILPGAELFADDVVHRDPYVDDELLDFLARVPMSLRLEHPLQRAYLRHFPPLARVPNPKDGVAPGLTGWRRAVARRAVYVRRGFRTRLDRPLRRAGLPPRRGYSDYASHLNGRLGARALGVLLDDRTLDRGQIRREAVRELVNETLAGRAAHTRALGTLLTLELFQRQFLDGDGYTQGAVGAIGDPASYGV